MTFDLGGLSAAVAAHGRVVRVVVAATKGSAPREPGAAMLVWTDAEGCCRQSGTIGGGALELAAVRTAQGMLSSAAGAANPPAGAGEGDIAAAPHAVGFASAAGTASTTGAANAAGEADIAGAPSAAGFTSAAGNASTTGAANAAGEADIAGATTAAGYAGMARTGAAGMARAAHVQVTRHALGPDLGQCCGGAVTLLTEVWDSATLARVQPVAGIMARPVETGAGAPPLAVRRLLNRARAGGVVAPTLTEGWMAEPVLVPRRSLWVWGAGHVGRAVIAVLAPLPDLALTWIDTDATRFPDTLPAGVVQRVAANPGDLVPEAPVRAEHLILTFSHALDLDLCHRLLIHGHGGLGLIGSASKRARFRSRLRALGHSEPRIDTIVCPIGDPGLGKHPQAIAVGVAAAWLRRPAAAVQRQGTG